jgi:feruloyl-CoA synthase
MGALFAAPQIEVGRAVDGSLLLKSRRVLPPSPRAIGEDLVRWAARTPARVLLGERREGAWRHVTYGEAVASARALGQALLDRGVSAERPLLIIADNGVDHALLALGALHVGVPVIPVSPAYSRLSRDHARLKQIAQLSTPGLIYVDDLAAHRAGLRALDLPGLEVVTSAGDEGKATRLSALLDTRATGAVDAAFARIGPTTLAKILFTSGSTGMPKAVPNTHGMLTVNQTMLTAGWPFLEARPPVILDWLPWSHTFGGNHNFNMVLRHGGTLWIDEGRPTPTMIQRTVANLREISPTIYFNVPRGYAMLLDALEEDRAAAEAFVRDLDLLFYAAAALPPTLWERLERLTAKVRGTAVPMVSAWGLTETSPLATQVHFPIDRPGNIGVPSPGCEVKLVPDGEKLEVRVRGPHVMAGYWRQPAETASAFDEEGFFRTGDAVRLANPAEPSAGLIFDGRIAENFKLLSGTWVNVGELRVALLGALAPLADDAVITGHDRDEIGALVFPSLPACRRLCEDVDPADAGAIVSHPAVRSAIADALARFNSGRTGSSTTIARCLLLEEPPAPDGNEITDKGYLNQRAILRRRAASVAQLHEDRPGPQVISPARRAGAAPGSR